MADDKPVNDKLARLLEQKKMLEARIRKEQNRENSKQREIDARRKILAGAWVPDGAEKRKGFGTFVLQRPDSFLSKPGDRALFGLPPRPEGVNSASPEQNDGEPQAPHE